MYKALQPLSPTVHGQLKFAASANMFFASQLMVAELLGAELGLASQHFPLAFTREGEVTSLVALLSIVPGRNQFVGKDGGWLAGYVPAALRGYPFLLAPIQDGQEMALVADVESGLFSETAGQPLFEDDKPSALLQQIIGFLGELNNNRLLTQQACAALHQCNALVPWQITVGSKENPTTLQGLYRVDEAALSQVSDADYLNLRQLGALPMAYAQLLSMGRLGQLAAMARQQTAAEAKNRKLLGQCFNLDKPTQNSFKF